MAPFTKKVLTASLIVLAAAALCTRGTKRRHVSDRHGNGPAPALGVEVRVGYRYISYLERGTGELTLDWEPIIGGRPIAYEPSADRWKTTMPPWATNRRDDIMATVKAKTRHMDFVWQVVD